PSRETSFRPPPQGWGRPRRLMSRYAIIWSSRPGFDPWSLWLRDAKGMNQGTLCRRSNPEIRLNTRYWGRYLLFAILILWGAILSYVLETDMLIRRAFRFEQSLSK